MRVLVISPNFFDYPQVICEQLGKMGIEGDVPAPRVRDRAVDRRAGPRFGPLLAAQQHDDGQRAEDGQVAGQLHHPRGALYGQP